MVRQSVLSNGIRVVSERMEGVRSVAIGVWINAGSAFETDANAGVSHFIEHMLFKGTATRSAADIAAETDAGGGELNAFTAKECTCYHALVPYDRVETAVALLYDLIANSTLDPKEMEKEKRVVLEEIAELNDSPEDLAFDGACAALYKGTPLEPEILGTEASVAALTREDLVGYLRAHYTAENTVIAVAGCFEEDALFALLERYFGACAAHGALCEMPEIAIQKGLRTHRCEKDAEQINLCIALPGAPLGTDAYEALAVLSDVLGGSMSSRLFQHIREERGLSYSVYSYPTAYQGAGCLCLYASTSVPQAGEVLRCILDELDAIKTGGVTEAEFVRAKQQLSGSYLLSMESSAAHMNALGKCELLLGQKYDFETTKTRIECVTMEAVQEAVERCFTPTAMAFCAVGRLKTVGDALERDVRRWWERNARADQGDF